ncbi:TPA: Cox family DNA-binding protein [Serratia fonticola]
MEKQVVRLSDALPYQEFAKVIGKTPEAVKGMIDKNKLPVVEMRTPEVPTARAEYWVYLPAWNEGMKLAFESRPKEIRDGWLQWLGLGESSSPVR